MREPSLSCPERRERELAGDGANAQIALLWDANSPCHRAPVLR